MGGERRSGSADRDRFRDILIAGSIVMMSWDRFNSYFGIWYGYWGVGNFGGISDRSEMLELAPPIFLHRSGMR